MTINPPDQLDRIAELLEQSMRASNERMTRIEVRAEQAARESNERMASIEAYAEQAARESNERMASIEAYAEQAARESNERLTRIEQVVESNNRFLESLSQDLRRYSSNMERLTHQLAAVTANANQDRMETNTRLSAIQGKVDGIAKHLGIGQ